MGDLLIAIPKIFWHEDIHLTELENILETASSSLLKASKNTNKQ